LQAGAGHCRLSPLLLTPLPKTAQPQSFDLLETTMSNALKIIMAGLIFVIALPAVEKKVDLNGTWALDPARSDSGGQTQRTNRTGTYPSTQGGIAGILLPRIGIPGMGIPGSRTGRRYPGGSGGDDKGEPEERMPQAQMQNLTLQIVQTDIEVQTTRQYTLHGEDQTITQKFSLDGLENTNPASNGYGEFISRSSWKNERLVNSGSSNSSISGEGFERPMKEEYSLSKDGKTLTIKTTRTTSKGDTNSKHVFNRTEATASSSSRQ
jgi:hypothetical protein